jgi:glycogen operon protein
MGVDGFRFDLASVLSRDTTGAILPKAPLIERIAEHPVLRDVMIIAEAWDAAGAYQVGEFGTVRWAEWNGKYRDDTRSFIKADFGSLGAIGERLTGSASMYLSSAKSPESSINFITCHDGFTLYDLVSYNDKHNMANGEENRDGTNDNRSWNCGAEGETDDPHVTELRFRQMKNAMSLLMLSLGVPMITAGDEFGRTQKGNNNAYCQDGELSWIDWSLLEKNRDFFRFVKSIIEFRKRHPALRRKHFYKIPEGCELEEYCDIVWFGRDGKNPVWKPDNHDMGVLIKGWVPDDGVNKKQKQEDICIILNSHWENHDYILPRVEGKHWYYIADTSKNSPDDIVDIGKEYLLYNQSEYRVLARSVVILVAKNYNLLTGRNKN